MRLLLRLATLVSLVGWSYYRSTCWAEDAARSNKETCLGTGTEEGKW